ncbi:MAG: hypothetical protein WD872_06540 [Pirellulaceae bacterium]
MHASYLPGVVQAKYVTDYLLDVKLPPPRTIDEWEEQRAES